MGLYRKRDVSLPRVLHLFCSEVDWEVIKFSNIFSVIEPLIAQLLNQRNKMPLADI